MNKKESFHICKDCNNFTLIFKKSVCDFDKTDFGICCLMQELVKKDNKCVLYKLRAKNVKTVTLEHLDSVIEDIKELEQIFYNVDF